MVRGHGEMGDRRGGWLIWRVGEGEGVVGVGKGGVVQRETRKGPGRRGGVAGGIGFEVAVEKGSGGRI